MNFWKIKHKVNFILQDNAANMVAAIKHLKLNDFRCLAHTINLIIEENLFTVKTIEFALGQVRKIVDLIKNSFVMSEKLKEP